MFQVLDYARLEKDDFGGFVAVRVLVQMFAAQIATAVDLSARSVSIARLC